MSDYLDPNNKELLKDFFLEAQMQVDLLEQNVLVLENDPNNSEAVDEIFRAAHTLKGGAGTVQMSELAEFTHIVEDVLDEIRGGQIRINEDVVDLLLNAIDIIKAMLEARNEGEVYKEDISQLANSLKSLLGGTVGPPNEAAVKEEKPQTVLTPESLGKFDLSEYELLELQENLGPHEKLYKIDVHFNPDNPMNSVGGIQVFASLKDVGVVLKTVPEFELLYEDRFFPLVEYYLSSQQSEEAIAVKVQIEDVTTEVAIHALEPMALAKETKKAPLSSPTAGEQTAPREEEAEVMEARIAAELSAGEEEARLPSKTKESKGMGKGSILRVDSQKIDNLLNLVSETVINKAAFNQLGIQFTDVLATLQNSETVLREKIKELLDAVPEYVAEAQNGRNIKDIRKHLYDEYAQLTSLFDQFGGVLKSNITKYKSTAQNFGRITNDLHEGVLQIRMVPISQIFSRFPRLIRDVSKKLNKNVKLIIEGEESELDKSVIEDLLDPLIHCVRNSLDHGLETPQTRQIAGKDEMGKIYLRASNEGNLIIIEVEDDGKGIDVEEIREKAIERGIIHPSKNLSDIEAYNLIFEPGFSTAKAISNISGRGVGLDVVKKQIEKLNGTVSVWSESGSGTKLTIKLPLTLAIIQGLLVQVGKEIYAIPINSVLESHRIKPSEIKLIDNYEVFNVREDVVSLIRLNRLFRLKTEERKEFYFVVIVGNEDKKMGLIVDALVGEEDVVIKPLKDKYSTSPGIAGATILGDGTVSLIIDVSQLLELGLKKEREQREIRGA